MNIYHLENDKIDMFRENVDASYIPEGWLSTEEAIEWSVSAQEYVLASQRNVEADDAIINYVPVPTEAEIVKALSDVIQAALDAFAQQKNYDGIMSACSYANSTNSKFKAEAEYCIKLRDDTWNRSYEILDDVKLGIREQPTVDNIVSLLPIGSASWNDVTY